VKNGINTGSILSANAAVSEKGDSTGSAFSANAAAYFIAQVCAIILMTKNKLLII
jgi:hypothetical protein